MASPTGFALVLTTAGSDEQATTLAAALVERRLAACVNVVPKVRSFYRWEGKVTMDDELLLVIKTSVEAFPRLSAAIHELHAYEQPEIVLIPIADGDDGYLRWLGDCL